jgi:hypothetical protein
MLSLALWMLVPLTLRERGRGEGGATEQHYKHGKPLTPARLRQGYGGQALSRRARESLSPVDVKLARNAASPNV